MRRFLLLDPRPKERQDDFEATSPRGVAEPPIAAQPARSAPVLRRRLIPIVPLAAITVIVLVVVGSVAAELLVIPFVADLPKAALIIPAALSAAIFTVTCSALWWLWRGRPVTTAGAAISPAEGVAQPPAAPDGVAHSTTRTGGRPRTMTWSRGVPVAALIAAFALCAPAAVIAPILAQGWYEYWRIFPWYIQIPQALFASAIITLPAWVLWRGGRRVLRPSSPRPDNGAPRT